ncbi:hypothetical protein [Ornithinimicrobium cerasi]|uniref:Uncharacterized protein n=1 Tax=Ornithinimicrobium cerasi TaxID=2248773 RepID=A0A285VPB8_9MICO|nr:hypothetical protein [Ornithinimicrobium cerasi]SOC55428.1 hypothetical protein SAMN05421879_10579 [Ornithinimicrobium cerasi]
MTLDQRLARAVRHVADEVTEPQVDVTTIRARAHARAARRRGVGAAVTTVVLTLMVVAGVLLGDPRPGTPVGPAAAPPSPTADTQAPTAGPMDTSSWLTYTSERYDLTIGYPPDWTVDPATRDWSWTQDAGGLVPDGMEGFSSPEGDIFVTVFSVTLEPGQDTPEGLRAWVEDYCQEWTEPCAGLDERAIELCVGAQECHPGLLVAFSTDVQAFLAGRPDDGRLVVASVWRNDGNITVQQRYGSFTRLLEGFLSTMDVRRAPTDPTQ